MVQYPRAPGFLLHALFVMRRYLHQSRDKACIIGKLGGPGVVGVTILYGAGKYYLRPERADCTRYFKFFFRCILKEAVLKSQVYPRRNTEDLRGSGCLLLAKFRGSTGTQFTAGEVDYPHFVTLCHVAGDGSPTAEFCVVRMSRENQNIKFHRMLSDRSAVSISRAARNFSASRAPIQPVPAAVTAWR